MIRPAEDVRFDSSQVIVKTDAYKRFYARLEERIEEAQKDGQYEIELGGIPETYFYVIQAPLSRMGYRVIKSAAGGGGGNIFLYVSWLPELI